jgi:hypothetical protein
MAGQIIGRGRSTWLVRVYQGCDPAIRTSTNGRSAAGMVH